MCDGHHASKSVSTEERSFFAHLPSITHPDERGRMKYKPFSSAISFSILAGFVLLPASASAFDPAPLCAYPMSSMPGSVELGLDSSEPEPAPEPPTLACDPTGMHAPPEPAPAVMPTDAREALDEARRLAAAGRPDEAVLRLRAAAAAAPELADRFSHEEGEYRMAAGDHERACEAFERVRQSPHASVALRGRIAHVRCLLTTADEDAVEELESLRRSYSELGQVAELELLLGAAHETWGDPGEAGQVYRRIDLMYPGSAAAEEARARFARLRADGVELRELTLNQRVDRAERLVRRGPLQMARDAMAALWEEDLPQPLAQQLARVNAHLARHEGDWDEAARLLRIARGLPELDDEEREAIDSRLADLDRASDARDEAQVQRRIRMLTRGRRLEGLPTARLFGVLRTAARGGEVEVADRVVAAIAARDRMPPGLRLDAALIAAGTVDDAILERLLEPPSTHPRYEVPASYHRARALERLGRQDEARALYARVIENDSERLPYYAMWARQRLHAMSPDVPPPPVAALTVSCAPEGPYSPLPRETSAKTGQRERRAAPPECVLPLDGDEPVDDTAEAEAEPPFDPIADADETATMLEIAGGPERTVEMTPAEIAELLRPLAAEHGDAFPYLRRALVAVELGELQVASDEVHEVYLTWSEARGRGAQRADLEGVLRGGRAPRRRVARDTWRARRLFPEEARQTLARVAAGLGDHGLAIRLSHSFDVAGPRPRAFADLVEASAARHGVDPELLWAVMRVESIYNPRIISYAGAIGLMQIMPRTGTLIAYAQGRTDFTVDELLDPATNIDMAAWYLASLIERFQGRIPLAIASYNGGPHNVRAWIRDYGEELPVDAFLEHIPFGQTHRYVRRVMTHYEAYLAQRGETLDPVDTRLPQLERDLVAF